MLKKLFFISFSSLLVVSCLPSKTNDQFHSDLKEIRKKGKLTVLFENSSLSYFEYRGKKMGFEYEILDSFSKHIGLPLEIKVVSDSKEFSSYLNDGEGDIISANLAVSLSQKEIISYSVP